MIQVQFTNASNFYFDNLPKHLSEKTGYQKNSFGSIERNFENMPIEIIVEIILKQHIVFIRGAEFDLPPHSFIFLKKKQN